VVASKQLSTTGVSANVLLSSSLGKRDIKGKPTEDLGVLVPRIK